MDWVRSLGADRVIDYKNELFENEAGNVDLVYDLIAGKTLERSWRVLKEQDGRIVSTLGHPTALQMARLHHAHWVHMVVTVKNKQLAQIARLIVERKVRVKIAKIFPLEKIQAAHRLVENGHVRRKVLVTLRLKRLSGSVTTLKKNAMNVTYYGHACFSVLIAGKHLLFDPYITQNRLAKSVDIKQIPADYIFISHGHDDHVGDVIKISKRTEATVIANFEVAQWLEKKGAPKVHALNPGGSFDFDVGRVKSVVAIHSSSMPNGACGGVPSGFVIESNDGAFYYSGDTALTLDMKLIAEETKLNFAVLCIGGNFTMGVDDAIRASNFIKCDQVLGVHYDTFREIKINHIISQQKFSAHKKTLHLLQIKQTINLG